LSGAKEDAKPAILRDNSFAAGETVRVVSGPFADFLGVISESLPEHNRYKVLLDVFGRGTPIELDADQVRLP